MNLETASNLAHNLMNEHGLTSNGWRFKFDTAKRRFGVCRYRRKVVGLSKELTLLNDENHVKNTILHEIAHALVGPGHGHDEVWRMKAIEIGCDGKRCYDGDIVSKPESKYIAVCPNCNHTHEKHRNRIGNNQQSCGKCDTRFNPKYILEWKINPNFLVV